MTQEHAFSCLLGHKGAVLALASDEAQQRLYTASVDCTIKVCERGAGRGGGGAEVWLGGALRDD